MKYTIYAFLACFFIGFLACEKESLVVEADLGDEELIAAIQKSADKTSVAIQNIPQSAQTHLEIDYPESFVDQANLVPSLGYQIVLRKAIGTEIGEKLEVYFNLRGRKLLSDRLGDKFADARHDRPCFTFVYPLSYLMPDGSIITGDSKQALFAAIKAWYEANPDTDQRPALQFPVDVTVGDSLLTLDDSEDLRRLLERCRNGQTDRPACVELVYPVTYLMPDGSTITGDSKQEIATAIRAWYADHPDVQEKPTLQFPVDVIFRGDTLTIENEVQLRRVRAACKSIDRAPCIELVYPVTYIMPDSSTITGDSKREIAAAIRAWYADHPDVQARPALQYPVDVVFKGRTVTVNSPEQMKRLRSRCLDQERRPCIELVYPVTYNMPDGSTITGDSEAAIKEAIRAWYAAHPDVLEKPTLHYPVNILFKGKPKVIENEEQMRRAKASCG